MVRGRSSSVNRLSRTEISDRNVDALFLVWLVSRSTADLLDTTLRPAGLTADEFAIYSILASAPRITPTELARWMAAPATTVSTYVKRLETRGHLIRETHPHDGRSYRIRLSRSGQLRYEQARALFAPVRSAVAHALAADERDVRDALLRIRLIVDDLRQQPGPASPGEREPGR
jgi:DNA-binding MarR family transcriptional regulator